MSAALRMSVAISGGSACLADRPAMALTGSNSTTSAAVAAAAAGRRPLPLDRGARPRQPTRGRRRRASTSRRACASAHCAAARAPARPSRPCCVPRRHAGGPGGRPGVRRCPSRRPCGAAGAARRSGGWVGRSRGRVGRCRTCSVLRRRGWSSSCVSFRAGPRRSIRLRLRGGGAPPPRCEVGPIGRRRARCGRPLGARAWGSGSRGTGAGGPVLGLSLRASAGRGRPV